MATPEEMDVFKKDSRLGDDGAVDEIEVQDKESQQAFVAIGRWLDELGI